MEHGTSIDSYGFLWHHDAHAITTVGGVQKGTVQNLDSGVWTGPWTGLWTVFHLLANALGGHAPKPPQLGWLQAATLCQSVVVSAPYTKYGIIMLPFSLKAS